LVNVTKGGDEGGKFDGKTHTAEAKRKQSISKLGNKYGKGQAKGFKHKQETLDKKSLQMKGNQYAKNYKHSEEAKQAQSLRMKGTPCFHIKQKNPLTVKIVRQTCSEAQKGNTNAKGSIKTEEWKKTKGIAMKGNSNAKGSIRTKEMRLRAREKTLKYYADKKSKQIVSDNIQLGT
jgi:hypothetical protein